LGCATDDAIRPATIGFNDRLKSAVFTMIEAHICHVGNPALG
jgi:hypothetical protein